MQTIQIHTNDNVVVALHPIAKGEKILIPGSLNKCGDGIPDRTVEALEDIPQGHKMSISPISEGQNIVKYGFPIGHALCDVKAGTWMHTHNVKTNLEGEIEYTYNPQVKFLDPVEPETFNGFKRKDGRAAIRNEIWIF